MKKLIFVMLLLTMQLSSMAQIVINLPDSLVGKTYLRNYVKQALKDLDNTPTVPVVPQAKACPAGPLILSISDVSTTSLRLKFHGEDVFVMAIEIYSETGTLVFSIPKYEPTGPDVPLTYPGLVPGKYKVQLRGVNCTGVSESYFTVPVKWTGEIITPDPTDPPSVHVTDLLGTYETVVNGRTYIASRTPSFSLSYTSAGISDNTPGLKIGTPNKIGDDDIYYMIGYSVLGNTSADGKKIYHSLQNLSLPDGIYSIRQFRMKPGKISGNEDFRRKLGGWETNDVNNFNGSLSEIFLSIHTAGAPLNPLSWLRTTHRLEFPKNGLNVKADGTFATFMYNVGDDKRRYQDIGVNTEAEWTDNQPIPSQPYSFKVWKWGTDGKTISVQELISNAAQRAAEFDFSPETIVMDEYPENTQGQDDQIHQKMHHWYRQALEYIRVKHPGIDKNKTGLYGAYGAYSFQAEILGESKQIFKESLTTKVHNWLQPGGGGWKDVQTYFRYDIDVNNVNLSYYMYNGERQLALELLYLNERVKVGTMTYDGKNRESKWQVVTMPMVQSLVRPGGVEAGIEGTISGELIKFKNGYINPISTSPSLWDEHFVLGFYSTLLGSGLAYWGEWGVGSDSTKFNSNINNPNIRWITDQGNDQYRPGFNGAPLSSNNGISASLSNSSVDAGYAGWKHAKQLKGRTAEIYHASYSSNLGSFTAVPGSAGLRISGNGFLNKNLFVTWDAFNQKKGAALVGEGPEGGVAIYYNGFLSQHEKEENVIITHKNRAVNIGTVYGRQLVTFKF